MAGRPRAAEKYIDAAFEVLGQNAFDNREGWYISQRAAILGFIGDIRRADNLFCELERRVSVISSLPAIYLAEFWLSLGRQKQALELLVTARTQSERASWSDDVMECNALLALIAAREGIVGQREALPVAREYANRSGHVRLLLRCHYAWSEIARREGRYQEAIAESQSGIQLADSCGFGRWSLDIRTELANSYLASGNPKDAIPPAEWVLKRSREDDCQYAWGVADSLHLLGIAHARLGDKRKAREI